METKATLLLAILAGVNFLSANACRFPPSVWCSTRDIARECKVEEQCEQYLQKDETPQLVDFTLYYESLCPDCQNFFKNQLVPAMRAVGHITNLTLVPYGNAVERKSGDKWAFNCQHGPEECKGNLIETCALHVLRNQPQKIFPFISCMELSRDVPEKSFIACAARNKIDHTVIDSCVGKPIGNQLEHQMAVKTNRLQPPHTSVPWVTLHGVHTDEIQNQAQENLVKLICDSYKGQKPSVCTKDQTPKQCLMDGEPSGKPQPVSVALYYESLCPFCKIFLAQQMYPVYKQLGADVMNVTLVPYGNAKEEMVGKKYKYTCQHGPAECTGNVIETCAMYLLKDVNIYFEYIYCIESSNKMPNESSAECAQKQGVDYKSIMMCANGDMGNQLEHEMAELTGELDPPHQFVPWIVVNGQHTDDIQHEAQENLLKTVCDMYKGPKPSACATASSTQKRCYKD